MRPKVAASLVVLGIAVLPACSAASKAGSTSSSTSSTQSTGDSGATQPTSGSGSSRTGGTSRPHIKVSPRDGHRSTHFVVTFTAPQRTGTVSGATRRYQVGAATPQGQGCVATAAKSLGASHAGARLSTTLTPVGGHWCSGTYRGKIVETITPKCAAGKVCPAFIGILHTVGRFKFRVS